MKSVFKALLLVAFVSSPALSNPTDPKSPKPAGPPVGDKEAIKAKPKEVSREEDLKQKREQARKDREQALKR